MKIYMKWFLTGRVSELEDSDEILGPQTSVLELKGLIQIQFGFKPKETLIIHNHLLDNHVKLRDVGVVDQATADTIVFTVHVVRDEGLEKPNAIGGGVAEEQEDDDDALQEFSHEDMILAMKMLGKDVPVSAERLDEVRREAPRARPAFLNAQQQPEPVQQQPTQLTSEQLSQMSNNTHGQQQQAAVTTTQPPSKVHAIFREVRYGLRAKDAEDRFAIQYPGVDDAFQYWDCRLPEDPTHNNLCEGNEVCLDMFFFGDIKPLGDGKMFTALLGQKLEQLGFKVRMPLMIREAGCMYPLVAVAILLAEVEAMELCNQLFDDFGTAPPSAAAASGNAGSGAGGGCAQQ